MNKVTTAIIETMSVQNGADISSANIEIMSVQNGADISSANIEIMSVQNGANISSAGIEMMSVQNGADISLANIEYATRTLESSLVSACHYFGVKSFSAKELFKQERVSSLMELVNREKQQNG
ncbi:TPA: hypothetical protein ACRZ6V_001250 [Vibrio harveyi]